MTAGRILLRDLIVMGCAWALALGETAMREQYHDTGQLRSRMLLMALGWGATAAVRIAIGLRRPVVADGAWSRTCVAVSFAASAAWLIGPVGRLSTETVMAALALAAVATVWLLRLAPETWARLLTACCTGLALFVAVPPVVAWLHQERLSFPREGKPEERGADLVQVFLLLDELNARSAPPLVQTLSALGLQVNSKAVHPVAHHTINVIPQLVAGRPFPKAKACGPSSVCSGADVLSFSGVTAARPDIDVVGFYHPYCAMKGLRWCDAVEVKAPAFWQRDLSTWACALEGQVRRFGVASMPECQTLRHAFWIEVQGRFEASLRAAPTFERGGLLFAHLPLPHPPGADPAGTLEQHYADNLRRAGELLRALVNEARARGKTIQLVVFSDHPLRQAYWCGQSPEYRAKPCRPSTELDDPQVPVIVAGDRLPDLRSVDDNAQVFRLQARW